MTEAAKSLKELLAGIMPENNITKLLSYINGARRDEKNRVESARRSGKQIPSSPVTSNSDAELYTLAIKYHNLGLVIDGINVVITGHNMAMVTYHGYKNKVLQSYPEASFDVQLVRENDMVKFAKESGNVVYSHEIADPFGNTKIVGAYCVITTKRGEFLETLNESDFGKMRSGSKMATLWNTWESEFWLKSVLKRACKRHFNDIVADIDKVDNEDYGTTDDNPALIENEDQVAAVITMLREAVDLDTLRNRFLTVGALMKNAKVVAAKDARKEELLAQAPTKEVVAS